MNIFFYYYQSISILLKFRLQWYFKELHDKFIRFIIASFIALILIGLPLYSLMYSIAKSILLVLQSPFLHWYYFFEIFTIQFVSLLWVTLQKEEIFNYNMNSYIISLPISKKIIRATDIVLLIIANNIIWLPFIFLLNSCISTNNDLVLIRLISFVFSILAFQIIWFRQKIFSVAAIIIINILFYATFHFSSKTLNLFILLLLFFILFIDFDFIKYFKFYNFLSIFKQKKDPRKFSLIKLQSIILWRQFKVTITFRMFIALVCVLFSDILLINNQAIPSRLMLIICESLIIVIFSGLYLLFKNFRALYSAFLASLPFTETNWYLLDYIYVVSLELLCNFILISVLLSYHTIDLYFLNIFAIYLFIMSAIIMAIRIIYPHQGVWISVVVITLVILSINIAGIF